VPPIGAKGGTADVRDEFARVTEGEPNDEAAVRAFVASKVHMLRSHPLLRQPAWARLAAKLEDRIAVAPATLEDEPTPGGVGYGVFDKPDFKSAYATGTAIYWEIICPNPPGGNVETWLYQTAHERGTSGACRARAVVAFSLIHSGIALARRLLTPSYRVEKLGFGGGRDVPSQRPGHLRSISYTATSLDL
jgi:hypothetical protein